MKNAPPASKKTSVAQSRIPGASAAAQPTPLLPDQVRFEDVFAVEDLQRLQDAFAEAADVASLITDLQGRPLTRPSNFTDLCANIIRRTEKGLADCMRSDARVGQGDPSGPIIHHCLGSGLLNGGTRIFFGDRHIANWLIGQVLDESADLVATQAYAREIGADEDAFREALGRVPRMSKARFSKVCQALYCFARHLSTLAMRNFRQSQLIGELRQAEVRIQVRDRNLADIIDFLPDPTLVVDKDGAVIFWNKALEKLTGIWAEDMLGKKHFEYGAAFYGKKTPLLVDYARGAVERLDPRYAVTQAHPDGIIAEVDVPAVPGGPRHVWVKAVALRDGAGHITGAIEAIRDVTDRYRADLALRESEAKFRRIVETAHEGVWVVDAAHKTTLVNRHMAEMLGYAPQEMLGRSPDRFMPEEELADHSQRVERQRGGDTDVYERCYRRKDGSRIWVLTSASPLYDASGNYLGALGMHTDITARKRIEKELAEQRQHLETEVEARTRDLQLQAMELAEANIRLSELDRLKSAFLSTVSHELRTPLTSILGFAKLIGREFADQFLPLAQGNQALENKGRRIRDNLAVVYNEAERLTRLINDVLDLNKIESGNMQWRDSLIEPVPLLRKTAQGLLSLLEQRPELTFSLELDEDIPALHLDPDQLVQIVQNLLNNAIKFTPAGRVRLAARRDGEAMLLAVEDTGIGIPAEQLESIFDKFHQVALGDTVTNAVKGTGLGLAICRQIVRHYGGRIWVESEPGRGSTFFVRLPLAAPPAS